MNSLSFSADGSEPANALTDRFIVAGWNVDRHTTLEGGRASFRVVAFTDDPIYDPYRIVDEMRAGLEGIKFLGQTAS